MNIFKAYFLGFKEAVRLPRPVFLIYFINLLLGVMIILPFYGIMDSQFGQSAEAFSLLKGFDYSVWADFFNNSHAGISLLLGQIKWSLLVYWLISIFLAGGIIRTLNQDKFTMTSFFSGAGYNFFKFFRISIVMLVLQIILILIVYIPTFSIIHSISGSANSELAMERVFFTGVVIHILLMLILLMTGDYSKYYAALYDTSKTFKAVKGGFSYVFHNFFRTYGLYLILVIVPGLLVYGYFKVDSNIGTNTKFGILVMFLLQQIFIILRIWFRVWIYSSPLKMFTADFLKNDDVLEKIAIMNSWQNKASLQTQHVLAGIMQNPNEYSESGVLTEQQLIEKIKKEEDSKTEFKKMEMELTDKISKKRKEKKNKVTKITKKDEKKIKKSKDLKDNKNDKDETFFEL